MSDPVECPDNLGPTALHIDHAAAVLGMIRRRGLGDDIAMALGLTPVPKPARKASAKPAAQPAARPTVGLGRLCRKCCRAVAGDNAKVDSFGHYRCVACLAANNRAHKARARARKQEAAQ